MERKKRRRKNKNILVFFLLIFLLILYVWQKNSLVSLGYRISEKDKEKKEMSSLNIKLKYRLMTVKSAERIRENLRKFKIELVVPEKWNIINE